MKKLLSAFFFFAAFAGAQIFPQAASSIRPGTVLPSTCRDSQVYHVTNTGPYTCIAGVWTAFSTGGGGGSSPTLTNIKTATKITDTGSGNAYAGTDANTTAAVDGICVNFQPGATNTGGATFALSGGTAKPILMPTGVALTANAMIINSTSSPSIAELCYDSTYTGGAWMLKNPANTQLLVQSATNYNEFAMASGANTMSWAQPNNPGDGNRNNLWECNGRSWDLSNTALLGALFSYGAGVGLVSGSAALPTGTRYAECVLTSGATSGNNVYYNIFGDDGIVAVGRNPHFDTTVRLVTATTSERSWIGLSGCGASTDAATGTPCTSGFLGFRYDTGTDSSWQCVVAAASATVVDSGVSPSTNEIHFKYIEDDTNNAVHFYINGTEVCTATAVTNLPSSSTYLTWHNSITTLTSAARGLGTAYAWIRGDK